MRGRVTWWNDAKGYGFLTSDDGTEVFVHFSAIETDTYKTLEEGEDVEFEIVAGPRGDQARSVRPMSSRDRSATPVQAHVGPPGTGGERIRGTVKWWSDTKGYGFLACDDGSDVFVHFSAIETGTYKTLEEGEDVEFSITTDPKGSQASHIIRLSQSAQEELSETAAQEDQSIGLAIIGGELRFVQLTGDGSYTFLDPNNHPHLIAYARSLQQTSLRSVIEEFEELISTPGLREQQLQDFLESYPDLVLWDEHAKAHPHVTLVRQDAGPLIPDFILEPIGESKLCDLMEIKLPSATVLVPKKNRLRLASNVIEACAQLREYSTYFDDDRNRELVHDLYGLELFRPKLFLLIGRRPQVSAIDWKKAASDLPQLHIQTYDDLLERMKARARVR